MSAADAFASFWTPYAQQAGNALGVAPNLILGQWALESGYGTNTLSRTYNVGSIMPGGVPAQYASPSDFTAAYVNLLQSRYPGALNTGNDASAFTTGLQGGTIGSYFGSADPQTYANNIASIGGSLGAGSATGIAGSAAPATASAGCGLNPLCWLGAFGSWAGSLAGRAALVAIGIVLLLGAILLFARDTEAGRSVVP